ncbi:MAG: hypothetical protein LBS19_12660 [Clostridiales bacterium]|nr:hypothetical protein [Clostridiales bacterium]
MGCRALMTVGAGSSRPFYYCTPFITGGIMPRPAMKAWGFAQLCILHQFFRI